MSSLDLLSLSLSPSLSLSLPLREKDWVLSLQSQKLIQEVALKLQFESGCDHSELKLYT